jgi:photosystem II stability/assembly factor-like uncharacterized protein
MKKMFLVLIVLCLASGSANPVFGTPPNTWVQTSDGLTAANNVDSFAFSPNYAVDNTVFAASSNVFKSTNGGLTWVPTTLNKTSGSLAFSSNNILMAATSSGVHVTLNGGVNWNGIHNNLPAAGNTKVVAFSPDYAVDQNIFAGTNANGLYKAIWDGNISNLPNWVRVPDIPTDAQVTRLVFSPNYAIDHIIFAGVPSATGTGRGIYKSTDGGGSWRLINTNNWNPQRTLSIESLAISPNFPNDGTLFTSLHPGVYKSTDGGESWTLLAGAENILLLTQAVSPNFAVDGTVFGAGTLCEGACLTTNGGKSWRLLNAGFPPALGMNIRTLAIPPNQTNQPFNVFSGNASSGTTTPPVWQMLYQNWRLFLPLILR